MHFQKNCRLWHECTNTKLILQSKLYTDLSISELSTLIQSKIQIMDKTLFPNCPEAVFLDVIGTTVLRVFPLALFSVT
jgi:hypothetical protein